MKLSTFLINWVSTHERDRAKARAQLEAVAADFKSHDLIDLGPVVKSVAPIKIAPPIPAAHLALARQIQQLRLGEVA